MKKIYIDDNIRWHPNFLKIIKKKGIKSCVLLIIHYYLDLKFHSEISWVLILLKNPSKPSFHINLQLQILGVLISCLE